MVEGWKWSTEHSAGLSLSVVFCAPFPSFNHGPKSDEGGSDEGGGYEGSGEIPHPWSVHVEDQEQAGDEGWQEADVRERDSGEGQACLQGGQSLLCVSAEEEHLSCCAFCFPGAGFVDVPQGLAAVPGRGHVVTCISHDVPAKKKKKKKAMRAMTGKT